MRKAFTLLLAVILVSVGLASAQNNINLINEGFETDGKGTRYTITNELAADCDFQEFSTRLTKGSGCWTSQPGNAGGTWLFGTFDNDGTNPGLTSVTFNVLNDLDSYTNFRFEFMLAAPNTSFSGDNYSTGTYYRIQYKDGAAAYATEVTYRGEGTGDGPLYREGNPANGAVPAAGATYTIPFSPTDPTGRVRFQLLGDVYAEFGVDDFKVIADCALPFPVITTNSIDGTDRICPGESVTLTSAETDAVGYKWYKDGSPIANSNSQTITITSEGDYEVELLSRVCNPVGSVTITEYPRPAVTTISSSSGSFSQCSNEAMILSADDAADDYFWEIDGVVVPNENSQSIDAIQYGSGSYQVFLKNEFDCPTGSVAQQVTVIQFTNPTITADGDETFCEDITRELKSTPGASYQWYKDSNPINGATNQELYISYPDSGTYSVIVQENTGCFGESNQIYLSTLPAPADPTITATGSTVICERDSVKLTSTFANKGYQWMLDGVEIPNATERDFYATLDGDYTVRSIRKNACTRTSDPFHVTVYDAPEEPTLSITADTTDICRGDNVTIVSSQANSYQWFKNGNQIPNQTFRSLFVTTEGEYYVRVGDGNNCTEFSDPVYIRVNVEQIAEITTQDSTTFCPDEEAILVSNYPKGNSWFFNGVQVTGVNTVEFAARDEGDYFAVVEENGCTDTTNTITINFFPRPTAPTITPGDTAVCDGSDVTFTASGASNYQWYFNGQLISGATNATYTATTSGKYACETVDNEGCTNRDTVRFTKFFEEPTTITPGDTTICAGDAITLTSNYEEGNQWYLDGNIIPGAVFQTYYTDQVGQYYVVVDLDNCTDQSQTITVTSKFAQPKPTITLNGPDLYCAGDSTELKSSNAVGYQWLRFGQPIAGETGKFYYPKQAGDYQVVASNQFGCTDTSFVQTINTHPAPIISSVDIENNSCEGQSNGGFTALAAGGTDPKEFSIDGVNWQPNGNFPNLGGGTYLLRLRDANNCKDSLEITIGDNPTSLDIQFSRINLTCFEGANGEIYLGATGGQPAYEFSIDGINFSPQTDFTGLAAGKYVATVRDNLGCEASTDTIVLTEPTELFATAIIETPITCADEDDGVIQASAVGGTPGYFFSIDTGQTFQSSPIFTDLAPGFYEILVADLNECTAVSDPIEVVEPDTLELSFAQVINHVSCFGEQTGLISVAAVGGTPPYEYSTDKVNYNPSAVVSNLFGGEYVVTVRDSRGCTFDSDTLVVEEGDSLYVNANIGSHVDCYNAENGSIFVAGDGGTGPLEYAIDLVNYQTSGIFTDLPAGIYDNITIRDSLGCVIFAEPIEVLQPDLFELSLDSSLDVSCSGANDGSIYLSSVGGAGGNTFSIDGGANYVADSTFLNLLPGTYNPIVKDASGCTAPLPDPVVILDPAPLVVDTVDLVHVTCNGLTNGSMLIYASGGTAPLSYSIDGGQTFGLNPILANLDANTYNVVVKDARGCTVVVGPKDILEPTPLVATAMITKQITCFGESDGEITVSASGANGGYLYSIDGGTTFQGSPVFSNLPAGLYQITVNDNLDCKTLVNIQLTDPAEIVITSLQVFNVTCNGANDGKILVNSVGGRGVRRYSIDGGTTYQTNGIFNGLGAGQYSLVIQDTSGCVLGPIDVPVNEPDTLTGSLVIGQPVVCAGQNDGQIVTIANGGTRPYMYSLNGAPAVTDSTFNNLNSGNYFVKVTDANGCVVNTSLITLSGPSQIFNVANLLQHNSCFNSNDGAIQANASGGGGNFTYSLDSVFSPSNVFSNLAPGTYIVYAKDANGCIKASNPVEVLNQNQLTISVSVDDNVTCAGDADGQITAYAVGGSNVFTYQLNNDPPVSLPVFQNLAAGQYIVKVIDDNGCTAEDTVDVTAPAPLNLVVDRVDSAQFGQSNGFIRTTLTGGTPPYNYVWSNGGTTGDIFGLAGGTYSVTAYDANGCFVTDTIVVAEKGIGIEERLPEFNMYPNPASTIVNLTWSSWSPELLTLYNELGEVVLRTQIDSKTTESFELNLDGISTGLYFIELSNGVQKATDRLMIME